MIIVAFIIFYYSQENWIWFFDGKQSRWMNKIDTLPHHTYHTHRERETHREKDASNAIKLKRPEHKQNVQIVVKYILTETWWRE